MLRNDPVRRLHLILSLAGVVVGLAVLAAIPELRHSVSLVFHGDLHRLRGEVRRLGAGGVLLIVALILAHAVLFFPSEIINAAAGFVYGFSAGLALVMVAWLVSALIAYVLGRTIARPLLVALFGKERFTRLRRAIRQGGITLLLVGRLLPVVPAAPMSYLAGASDIRVVRFSWTTVVGSLPLTASVTYLGSRAETLSLSDPLVWAVIALLIVLLGAARFVRFDVPDR
ncbi:MAG TPA: VTT domain-containing protein [Solirubrobacteraceae bacterium]|nr:VTT domain-containing protein [Solirubrobacteraceae bacterium]